MNTVLTYHSMLAAEMDRFVAFKRMQGYDYTDQARTLSYFDRFLVAEEQQAPGRHLRLDTLERYVATTAYLPAYSRKTRLASLRQFSRYLHARYPDSVVLPKDILPRHRRTIRFCRIEPEEVVEMMAATATILPSDGIRARSIGVLIGLLYSTGLRIGEALNLTLGNIEPDCSILHAVKGKFSKKRLVPMSPSTLRALTRYLADRERHASTSSSSPLFIGAYNTALTYAQVSHAFRRLCRHCGVRGDPPPRLHDLRHNYACRVLTLWRQAGMDINALLPVLATAMGHVKIFDTQIYLHIDAVALQDAADTFKSHITTHQELIK